MATPLVSPNIGSVIGSCLDPSSINSLLKVNHETHHLLVGNNDGQGPVLNSAYNLQLMGKHSVTPKEWESYIINRASKQVTQAA